MPELKTMIGTTWDWWGSEISALAPKGMVNWFLGRPRVRQIKIVDDRKTSIDVGEGEASLSQLLKRDGDMPAKQLGAGSLVSVLLPNSVVLTRQSEIPAAASGDARKILELEIARTTPFQSNDIFWSFETNEREGDNLSVIQYLVKAPFVEELQNALKAVNLRLSGVFVHSAVTDGPVEISATGLAPRSRSSLWAWANGSLIAVALCVGGGLVGYPYFSDIQELDAINKRSQTLHTKALALRTTANDRRAVLDQANALNLALQNRTSAILDIAVLTNAIPDDVWLSDLVYQDKTWTFSGYSSSSSAQMVLDLSRNIQGADVKLTGPVSISPGDGAERFEAALTFVRTDQ